MNNQTSLRSLVRGLPVLLAYLNVKVLLIDLWKTLARSTYPEPILDFQAILGYKTVMTPNGPKTELCPEFLDACLTTNEEDPDLFMAAIAKRFGIAIPAGASEKFKQLIENEKNGLALFLDVQDELRALKDMGYRIALLSNVWPFPTKHLLRQAGLEHVFDELILSYEVGVAKPNRGIFVEAAERFGVSLEDCLMVGDNVHLDVRGAKAVGMPSVHIDRYGDCSDFEQDVPVISKLSQLRSAS